MIARGNACKELFLRNVYFSLSVVLMLRITLLFFQIHHMKTKTLRIGASIYKDNDTCYVPFVIWAYE